MLVRGDNGVQKILESTHVTFDENRCPGASDLDSLVLEESLEGEYIGSGAEDESTYHNCIEDDE